jgi:hypothetical protein
MKELTTGNTWFFLNLDIYGVAGLLIAFVIISVASIIYRISEWVRDGVRKSSPIPPGDSVMGKGADN